MPVSSRKSISKCDSHFLQIFLQVIKVWELFFPYQPSCSLKQPLLTIYPDGFSPLSLQDVTYHAKIILLERKNRPLFTDSGLSFLQ